MFSSAFETGQLAPLVAQFGLPESATQSASIGGEKNEMNA